MAASKPLREWKAPAGRKSRRNIRLTRSNKLVVRKAECRHSGKRLRTRKKAWFRTNHSDTSLSS